MGFAAVLAKCSINLAEADAPIIDTIARRANFQLRPIVTSFSIVFDPTKRPQGPKSVERWRVGIVQNVLYDVVSFKYADGSEIKGEFRDSVLDCVDESALLFFSEPVPDKRVFPYRIVYCNQHGAGERLDSSKPLDNNVVLQQSIDLSHRDQPELDAPLRKRPSTKFPFGAQLVEAMEIISFGISVIAQDMSKKLPVQVIAHAETVSQLYSVTLTNDTGRLSIGIPRFTWITKVAKGRVTSRHAFAKEAGLHIAAEDPCPSWTA